MAVAYPCFNSKLVRLEVDNDCFLCVAVLSFNSKLVRLEVKCGWRGRRLHGVSFNSKLVRLEGTSEKRLSKWLWIGFNSKLVRLEVQQLTQDLRMAVRSFNSKLVRLEGYPNTALILYCTLTVPVKLIFHLHQIRGNLLSTSNRANSLGGWRHYVWKGFIGNIMLNWKICLARNLSIFGGRQQIV